MLGACLWSILIPSEVSHPELRIQAWINPGSSQVMSPLLPLGCSFIPAGVPAQGQSL